MYRQEPCFLCKHSGLAPIGTKSEKKRQERFYSFLQHKERFGTLKQRLKSADRLRRSVDILLGRYGERATPLAPQAIQDEFAGLNITRQEKWRLRQRKRLRCVHCGELRPCGRH